MNEEAVETEEAVNEEAMGAEEPLSMEEFAQDFNLFQEVTSDEEVNESAEKAEANEAKVHEEAKKAEPPEETSWSAKARKDRELRNREIALKKKEEEIRQTSGQLEILSDFRDKFVKNPEEVLKDLGVNPVQFFEDWTRRLVEGNDTVSTELQMSSNERKIADLEKKLANMEQAKASQAENARKEEAVRRFHSEISSFLDKTDDFPLTKAECSPEDIAKGIAAYYQNTGRELSFQEACEQIEAGLVEEENKLLADERLVQRIKEKYNLEATNQGKAARTLSSSMATHPTRRDPGRHPTIEEVMEEYGDRIFS